jgi:hypothetical protein
MSSTPALKQTRYSEAIAELLRRVGARLFPDGTPARDVPVVLAGGAAAHLYTGARVSKDVDAEFLARVLKPDVNVLYSDDDGTERTVHLDVSYTNTLGLMHEDYLDRSLPTHIQAPGLEVRLLSPVDLAISKLGRWADHDRSDVRALVEAHLLDRGEFERLANEALSYYVGNLGPVRLNLAEALAMFGPGGPSQVGDGAP